ncbi:MAG: efflux RND transporter periplasmic adaptor subunit [Saprospiraceae bacterium]|nr:efflux RND transporter periplasmic adaptor subunit [Saprospiraceae bacterium]
MSKQLTKKKNKNWLFISLAILFVALAAAAIYKAKTRPKGTEVEMGTAEIKTIFETVSASGKIYPEKEIKISSDVSGEIVELYVKEGDSVKVGQLLLRIDPDTYESAVERGRAAVNSSKSQRAMAKSQVETNRAQAEQIRAQLENARSVHQRNEQLKKEGVISQLEFDQSLSTLKGLEANLRAAEAGIKSAIQNVEASDFAIKSSEASLKELSTSLNRTTIKAPASGIVSSLSVEKGERVLGTIQMTGTEIMRISNLNAMEVQVDVTENDIPKVKLGDKVDIEVDAYTGKVFKGTVSELASSASNLAAASGISNTDQVTNFTVKIRIDPNSYKDLLQAGNKYPFRPGMSASVDIFTNKEENILVVPIQAVTVREKEGIKKEEAKLTDEDYEEIVFMIQADTLVRKKVETGIQDDEYIHIKSGLDKGAVIVTGPYNEVSKNLKRGDKVRKKEENKDKDKKDKS